MKIEIITADDLINFQSRLRHNGGTLIRAIPFTKGKVDCYKVMYV